MRKIIFTLSISMIALSVFAQKANIPYCFQGHTTDTSAYIWCITPLKDSSQTFSLSSPTENPIDIQQEWNTFDNYRYGHLRIKSLASLSNTSLFLNQEKILDIKTPSKDTDTLTLLVGSCAMITFGQHWIFRPNTRFPIYDVMSKTKNDAMIWMGDNLYFLGKEAYSDNKQISKYIKTRRVSQLVNFLQSTPQYAMWDDHDFGPNNSDGTFIFKDVSKKNFLQFWPNPAPIDSNEGIYYSIRYPQVEVFMTDNRYHAVNGERYYSDEQMKWIQEGLKNSTAPFKIIISGNQAYNTQTRHETLYRTGEFQKIIQSIQENQVSGVLFVNGDRHHSEMFKHQIPQLYPIYEFTNSSLTSIATGVRKRNHEYHNPARIHGVTKDHVFGKISVYQDENNENKWSIKLENINKKGKLLWYEVITLDEISFQ